MILRYPLGGKFFTEGVRLKWHKRVLESCTVVLNVEGTWFSFKIYLHIEFYLGFGRR